MLGYIAFYKGKQMTVHADTSYHAQQVAAAYFKAKKAWQVTVFRSVDSDGKQVSHSTAGF